MQLYCYDNNVPKVTSSVQMCIINLVLLPVASDHIPVSSDHVWWLLQTVFDGHGILCTKYTVMITVCQRLLALYEMHCYDNNMLKLLKLI